MPDKPNDRAIKVILGIPDAKSRMHIRRLLGVANNITVVATVRTNSPGEISVSTLAGATLLLDASDDPQTAALTWARIKTTGIRQIVILTKNTPSLLTREIPSATILKRPADLEGEASHGPFASSLIEALSRSQALRAEPNQAPYSPRKPSRGSFNPGIIAIGSSTGGPQALQVVMKGLAGRIKLPIVITQHMPASFTAMLADQLSRRTGIKALEAYDGHVLKAGEITLAPGNFHLLIEKTEGQAVCRLDSGPPENFCRPSVDPMLRSIVRSFGGQAISVILTGMGQDGLSGSKELTQAGGVLIAQDEATSVVWGMPGAVAQAGICNAILPLDQIAEAVLGYSGGTI